MQTRTMQIAPGALAAALALAAAPAQEPGQDLVFRDFQAVQRLRVVCEREHFGRLLDLVADVPSGRLVAAVVSMATDAGPEVVRVPYDVLRYDPQTNLLDLGPCLADGEQHPAFDPARVRVSRRADGDGDDEVVGTVMVSRLANMPVALLGGATGAAQGVTVELRTGHVAFCHTTPTRERAGDDQLHPAPWAAFSLRVADDDALALALPLGDDALEATPSLVQIILQDALYRPRVYEAFRVAPPPFDRP